MEIKTLSLEALQRLQGVSDHLDAIERHAIVNGPKARLSRFTHLYRNGFTHVLAEEELLSANPKAEIVVAKVVWPTPGCGMVCYAYGIQPPHVLWIGKQGRRTVRQMRRLVRRG